MPLRGRLFEGRSHESRPVAVGDRVMVRADPEGWAIEAVLPRDTQLSRTKAGDSPREQVLAANISLVLVMDSILDPPFQPELVDRILAGAEREKIDAALVITKVDRDGEGARARAKLYESLGYPVFCTSISAGQETTESLSALERLLHANITVFCGPSGVGKSSMINRLIPGLDLRVGSIGRIRQGKHTTTHTQLVPLPGGGHVLDTPGHPQLRSVPAGARRGHVPVSGDRLPPAGLRVPELHPSPRAGLRGPVCGRRGRDRPEPLRFLRPHAGGGGGALRPISATLIRPVNPPTTMIMPELMSGTY